MSHSYKSEIAREEINLLPLDCYRGPVKMVITDAEAAGAVAHLRTERVLGFDTETRASFTRGVRYQPALVQLAASDAVYLFRLHGLKDLGGLGYVFSDPFILKVGVGIHFDVRQLRELHEFEPVGFVELEKVTDAIGIKNNGLRGLTAIILGFRMSKKEKKSDWSRQRLTPSQVLYAATDAWVAREIYLKFEAEDLIVPLPAEEEVATEESALVPAPDVKAVEG